MYRYFDVPLYTKIRFFAILWKASASMLLFRVATGEAWQLIMLACIEAECDEVVVSKK